MFRIDSLKQQLCGSFHPLSSTPVFSTVLLWLQPRPVARARGGPGRIPRPQMGHPPEERAQRQHERRAWGALRITPPERNVPLGDDGTMTSRAASA